MAKIVISSLFTYDPIMNGMSQRKHIPESGFGEKALIDEADITSAILDTLKKVVVTEMVQSVMLCVMKKEIDNIVLIADNMPDTLQDDALKIIQSKLGDCVKIEVVRVDGTDALSVAKELVSSIDSFDDADEICINISSLKHTKTLGIIYGAYARSNKVKEIMYINKEDRKIVKIPKLSLNLTINQKKILKYFKQLQEGEIKPPKRSLYDHFKIEKSSFYFIKKTLVEKALLEENDKVTEMGEVALL